MANERGYVVGRGKPRVHSRFRKGQSGNLSGRRKGSKNLATRVRELLNGKILAIENGKRKTISLLSDTQTTREKGAFRRSPRGDLAVPAGR